MGREEFQAREKNINRMSKDGLLQENKTTGQVKNVSKREADKAFVEHEANEVLGRNNKKIIRAPNKKARSYYLKHATKKNAAVVNDFPPHPRQESSGNRQRLKFKEKDKKFESEKKSTPLQEEPQQLKFQKESLLKEAHTRLQTEKNRGFHNISRKALRRVSREFRQTIHKKIEEAGQDNSAVEAASKFTRSGEEILEKGHGLHKKAKKVKQRFKRKVFEKVTGLQAAPDSQDNIRSYKTAKEYVRRQHSGAAQAPEAPAATERKGRLQWEGEDRGQNQRLQWEKSTQDKGGRLQWDKQPEQATGTRGTTSTRSTSSATNTRSTLSTRSTSSTTSGNRAGKAGQQSNAASLKLQKSKLKRSQIKNSAEKKTKEAAKQSAEFTVRVVKRIAEFIRKNIWVTIILLASLIFVALFMSAISSVSVLLGNLTTTIYTSYVANDQDIHDAELLVTQLEAELEKEINDIPTKPEWDYIDEFQYDLDPIGHDPFVFMGYLTAKYQVFTYADMIPVIHELHNKRYKLTLWVEEEIRGEGEDEYTYYILHVELRSKTIEEVIQPEFDADETGELPDWFGVLMETKGNRQAYNNPFDYDWTPGISSTYGWRLDPIGKKDLQLHRGLDIPEATGTPICAGLTGVVSNVGHDEIFGNFIVLQDREKDRQLKYAHCDRIFLSVGEEVKGGETIIATVGNTGASTGSHVHIEVKENGQYRNPVYLVDWDVRGESESEE